MWINTLVDKLRGMPQTTGARGEWVAAKFLKRAGFRILAKNLSSRFGEIDILAQAPDERTIVVVEVKSSVEQRDELRPEVHVDLKKQRKLSAMAADVVRSYGFADRPVRFDVIGVDLPEDGKPVIRHHEGAFESTI